MLNSGNKFRAVRDIKKINILTLVLSEKKILNETKNHVAMPYSFTTIIRWNRHRSEKFDRKA